MNSKDIIKAFESIRRHITENEEYLTKLDRQNGDGDLGISMKEGFTAVCNALAGTDESDLGKILIKAAGALNEAAPSSLGTILSLAFSGMSRALRGKRDMTLRDLAQAMEAGVQKIMDKAGSKPGEKTILDAICPAVQVFLDAGEGDFKEAAQKAARAAAEGSEATRQMRSVHGRAAYYGEQSVGILDGGSVAGRLIFEALTDL